MSAQVFGQRRQQPHLLDWARLSAAIAIIARSPPPSYPNQSPVAPLMLERSFRACRAFVPAAAVAITRRLVEELFVHQSQQGAITVTLEPDRDQRLSFRSGTPRPGELPVLGSAPARDRGRRRRVPRRPADIAKMTHIMQRRKAAPRNGEVHKAHRISIVVRLRSGHTGDRDRDVRGRTLERAFRHCTIQPSCTTAPSRASTSAGTPSAAVLFGLV